MFLFDEDELVPEIRAQRSLNKARLPEIAEYILGNRNDYVFSAITASIDGDVRFEAAGSGPDGKRLGALHIPMSSRFIINDGQHRRVAIEMALREDPALADESIAVVFFIDLGLERCQQMFADLNRHAIRPSKSIGVLYDQRDEMARQVPTVDGGDVEGLERTEVPGVVPVDEMTVEPAQAGHRLQSGLETVGHVQDPDPAEVMSRHRAEEVQPHVRR